MKRSLSSDCQHNTPFSLSDLLICRASWPTTAYLKAADVWTTGCYVTVFASLAEYCLFLFLMEGGGGGKGSNKTGAADDKGMRRAIKKLR